MPDGKYEYYDEVEVKRKVIKIQDSLNFSAEDYYRPKLSFHPGSGNAQVNIINKNTKPLLKAVNDYRLFV